MIQHSTSRELPVEHSSLLTRAERGVYADALSQAVSGEWVGMLNYAALATLCEQPDLAADCVAQAATERRHALLLRAAAQREHLALIEDPNANYWGQVRRAFGEYIEARDWVACLLVQEILLEGVAAALYGALSKTAKGHFAELFGRLAAEEGDHAEHGVELLQKERLADPLTFDLKAAQVHARVMPVLAQMVGKTDAGGHCGLCAHGCVKQSLPLIGLKIAEMRGRVLEQVLLRFDAIGVPGEVSLKWAANLPL